VNIDSRLFCLAYKFYHSENLYLKSVFPAFTGDGKVSQKQPHWRRSPPATNERNLILKRSLKVTLHLKCPGS
jgi:hypothetical protein